MRESIRTILHDWRAANPDTVFQSIRTVAANPGIESTHIAVDATLAHLWVNQRNDVYRPHLVRSIAAVQRHEPTLLQGWHSARTQAAWFCILQQTLTHPDGRIMIVVEDDGAGLAAYQSLTAFVADIPVASVPQITLIHGDSYDADAQIVIAPYHRLHRDVLRQHDTHWKHFWQRLSMIVLLDIHLLSGIAWQHARWMLRRIERVRVYHAAPKSIVLLTATPAQNADDGVATLVAAPVTVVPVNDIPTPASLVGEIRAAGHPYAVCAAIARTLQSAGYRVHIIVDALCAPLLWEQELDGATVAARLAPADVVIWAGLPANGWALEEALHGGYEAVLTVQGQSAAESLQAPYDRAALPLWVCGTDNPYVHTAHLLAAAAEVPVLPREVASWALHLLCSRMEAQGYLRQLPGQSYVPAGADDPHAEFSLHDAIGLPALVQYAGESLTTTTDATLYERWLAPRMSVPPWRGGMVVSERDIAAGSVTIAIDPPQRLTVPIRTTTVRAVDRLPSADRMTGWARVAVDDALIGMREWVADEWHDAAYPDAFACTWYAPACWWDIGPIDAHDIPWLGWSLLAAIQAQAPLAMQSVVPCYDAASGRLYFVETQPGGTGFLQTIAPMLPTILAHAQRVVAVPTDDAVLTPFWRVDAGWLASAICPAAVPSATEIPAPDGDAPAQTESVQAAAPVTTDADAIPSPVTDGPIDDPSTGAVDILPVPTSTDATQNALMASLLDEPVRIQTERMPVVVVVPWRRHVVRWLTALMDQLRGVPSPEVFVLGDEVLCVPYGRGVVIAVEEGPAGVCYRVATTAYGDLVLDPRRDLLVHTNDKSP